MLRDPEQPEKSWQDYENENELNPERPFYAEGNTEIERDRNAKRRCDNFGLATEKRNDMAGGRYYFCRKRRNQ